MSLRNNDHPDQDTSRDTSPLDEDLLDEALNESFPASDPPAANHFD